MADNGNAESLHDKANTKKQVSSKFVSPGTPASPLVNESDMPQAKQKAGTDSLRSNLHGDNR